MPTPETTRRKAANDRWCYCDGVDADFRQKYGIPEGYCGICERCGQPGHTRHFPGAVPYTGAWCDRCYKIVGWTWFLRPPFVLIPLVILGVLLYYVFTHFLR